MGTQMTTVRGRGLCLTISIQSLVPVNPPPLVLVGKRLFFPCHAEMEPKAPHIWWVLCY